MSGRSLILRSALATRVSTPSPRPERVSRQTSTATDASSTTIRPPSTRSSSVMPLPDTLTSPIDSSAFWMRRPSSAPATAPAPSTSPRRSSTLPAR